MDIEEQGAERKREHMNDKLVDPVDALKTSTKSKATKGKGASEPPFDLVPDEGLLEEEIGGLPMGVARTAHPFMGYNLGREVAVYDLNGKNKTPTMISRTFLILLKSGTVRQDVSGQGVSHKFFRKDAEGNDIKPEDQDGRFKAPKVAKETRINLVTYHNAVTVHPSTKENQKWVFDRRVKQGQRWLTCCIVPSHSARAQLVFYIDKKTGKVIVNDKYEVADKGQFEPLRVLFNRANYQQQRAERLAQSFDQEVAGIKNAMGNAGGDWDAREEI